MQEHVRGERRGHSAFSIVARAPWSGALARFGKESRAHRGRNSRLAHRARQDSLASFRLRRQPIGLTFGSLPHSQSAQRVSLALQPAACFE